MAVTQPDPAPRSAGAPMTPTMEVALQALDRALDAPRQSGVQLGNWRWAVRQRMTAVRDALVVEAQGGQDGWLAARGGAAFRERNALLGRLARLGAGVLHDEDAERARMDLKRLVVDVSHHLQRLHDLAYDEVELELGGSD